MNALVYIAQKYPHLVRGPEGLDRYSPYWAKIHDERREAEQRRDAEERERMYRDGWPRPGVK